MNNKKLIAWMMGIPALLIVLLLIILFREPEKSGISRAEAARAAVLAVCTQEELSSWNKEYGASHFSAQALGQWYVPYMDYLYEHGWLSEEEVPADESHAEGLLTYREARQLASAVFPSLAGEILVTKRSSQKPYPAEQWWTLYDKLLKGTDPDGQIQKEVVVVYATPETIAEAPEWTAYTSLGALRFDGLGLDLYVDHEVLAYVRGTALIHVIEDQGKKPVYRNVWIQDGDENGITVCLGEIERTIPFKKKSKNIQKMIHSLADLQMDDGKISKVSLKQDIITGKVLSVQEDAIEIEGYGKVPLDREYKVLKTYGQVERLSLDDILVGYDMEQFVVADGKICAALKVRDFQADTIRVLLMNDDWKGLYHQSVTVSSSGPVTLLQGEKKETLEAGQELTFSAGEEQLAAGRVVLEPENGQEIRVSSLNRSLGTPSYGGRLEVLDTEQGLVVINELYLEDYLKKVVPSEMPSSYEKEALKAQAVCARTYAYMQIQSNTYSQYGAHVDDSTNFQVYNNVETNERTGQAVEETYGKMLLYDGKPISAYYFSTSCGVTTDAGVWGGDPAASPYLKSVTLQPDRKTLDLTDNRDFAEFIKNEDYPSYDSSYPLYRWRVVTNAEILTANIGGVGTVQSIEITERGAGGVAKKMLVKGTEGEKTVSGQNAIRSALGDPSLELVRKDGKVSEGWSSLPSGFLAIEDAGLNQNGVQRFRIYGGGYGHGAGMSQNGAQGMAKNGMSCEDILTFFYDGVTVENLEHEK